MDYDELKYKFDFSKMTMPEIWELGVLCQSAQVFPGMQAPASMKIMEVARKVSVVDIDTIPADMFAIFLSEFTEAYEQWMRDAGMIK